MHMPTPTHWQETKSKFPNPVSSSIPSETALQRAFEGKSPTWTLRASTLLWLWYKQKESSSHTQKAANRGHL